MAERSAAVALPLGAGIRANAGVWWLALAAAGLVAFFWDGFASLAEAWSRPEYSHGPLIPVIAAWLILRELRDRPPVADLVGSRWPGLAVLVLGLGTGFLGNLTQIPDVITYGSLIAIAGLILLLIGVRQGVRFWVGWLFLFFMLPLPNFMYWQLSSSLQLISSQFGVALIQAVGIPVYLEGNIIDLGVYKLDVAEACSGLRYLFPLMSFGFLFAVLYQGPVWHRLVLFLVTIPITIGMNSLRIGIIGTLVNYFGIEYAEGFSHYFEGWIIFVACVALLYFVAFLLQRLRTKPQSVLATLDLGMGGIAKPLTRIGHLPGSPWLVSAAIIVAVLGAIWQFAPARADQIMERSSFALFPMEIENWKGSVTFLESGVERVLAADDYILADYRATLGETPVNLFMAYYRSQTSGSGIHSPEVCIPGGGWEVSRWTQTKISLANPGLESLAVNRAIIRRGEQRQLVYYWFDQRGRRMTGDYAVKVYTLWDSIVRGRSDGALIRVVTPILKNGGEADADRRLSGFLEATLPLLPRYVPN